LWVLDDGANIERIRINLNHNYCYNRNLTEVRFSLTTAQLFQGPPLLKMIAWPPYLESKLFIKGGVKHRLAY